MARMVDMVIACCPQGQTTKLRFGEFANQIRKEMNEKVKFCILMTKSSLGLPIRVNKEYKMFADEG